MTATYTYAFRLSFLAAVNQSARPRSPTKLGRRPFAVQRSRPAASMIVGPQLVGDFPLLEAILRQPGVGAADRALDMIRRAREIIG